MSLKRYQKKFLRKCKHHTKEVIKLLAKIEALTAPVYVIKSKMTEEEIAEFREQWAKLGVHKHTSVIYMPEDIKLETFPKDKLEELIKQLTELKERIPNEDNFKS